MQLLRSPMICSQQAGDSGELTAEIQSTVLDWSARDNSLSLRAREDQCLSSTIGQEKQILLSFAFLCKPFTELGNAHLHWRVGGGAICFSPSSNSNTNLIQEHTHAHTQKGSTKYLAILWLHQVDTKKLTITSVFPKLCVICGQYDRRYLRGIL